MGIFSRLGDVINSNIHAMLDRAEDPEKMVRLIIQEMEDTLVEVRSTSVRALARQKEVQRALAQAQADADDWQAKAELAVAKDREDLARGALAARSRAQDQAEALRRESTQVEEEIARLDADTGKLKAKLVDARTRQKGILLRQQSATTRLKVRGQIHDARMQDAMLRMDQYESRIDRMEAELESYDLGTRSLKDEFTSLAASSRIDEELSLLRSRLGKNAAPEVPPAAPKP